MRTAILLAAWVLLACGGPASVRNDAAAMGARVTNKLATNKLATNKLATNKLATNRLSGTPLLGKKGQLDELIASEMLATEDGREVLEYLISCALPEDVTLVTDFEGERYEFHGALGLAPKWLDRKLVKSERGWISACMIARVNLYTVAVPVSLRGPHPALAVDPDEADFYGVEEGAFYGDIFTPDDEPLVAIACRGEGQALGEFGQIDDRDCAEEAGNDPGYTHCGFVYAGDCRNYSPMPGPAACEGFVPVDDEADGLDGGYYDDCHQTAVLGKWKGDKPYREVVTVFVHE